MDDVRCCCVFFQAEDGIRDLVRSRGLGDVYKRQLLVGGIKAFRVRIQDLDPTVEDTHGLHQRPLEMQARADVGAVSYTHLTLPTSDLV